MRKLFLPLAVAAGLFAAANVAEARPAAPAVTATVIPAVVTDAAGPALVQPVQYYGYGYHRWGRPWGHYHHRAYWHWRRHEAWRRWHYRHGW